MKNTFIIFLIVVFCSCSLFKKKVSAGKESRTVNVVWHENADPFEFCKQQFEKRDLVPFDDPNNFFQVNVNPNWIYNYDGLINGVYLYNWALKSDTSVTFTILVDSDLCENERGKNFAHIDWHDAKIFHFEKDSCEWLCKTEQTIDDGAPYALYEHRFQYYNIQNKRVYFLYLSDTKKYQNQLDTNCQCYFQEAIKSFKAVVP